MSERHTHHVLWHCDLLASAEHVSLLTVGDDRMAVEGRCVMPLGDVPCDIGYRMGIDLGIETIHLEATIHANGHKRELVVDADHGAWSIDGKADEKLAECTHIDLGWTPITNTVAIRSFDLEVGESATITSARFRFPELRFEAEDQTYTREAEDTWRYEGGPFEYLLTVDAETGIVTKYGDDLWESVAGTRT
jgi:uncharacterized protein